MKNELINRPKGTDGKAILGSDNTTPLNNLEKIAMNDLDKDKINDLAECLFVLNNKKYSKILNSNNKTGKAIRLEDASGRYSEFLKSTLNKNIKNKKLKIVLDCGNGATYDIALSIFWELGHQVVSINDKPNGKNINYSSLDSKCECYNAGSFAKW